MAKGGARPGAGRKPKVKLSKKEADSIIDLLGTEYKGRQLPTRKEIWISLVCAADLNVRLRAICAVEDREFGKPAQRVEVSGEDGGPIPVVVHTIRFGDGNRDRS